MLWTIDRSTPGRQIQEFFERADDLHVEMRLHEVLNSSPVWSRLLAHKNVFVQGMFILAVTQNIILMVRYSTFTEATYMGPLDVRVAANVANDALGLCQCFATVGVFVMYTVQEMPMSLRKRWREATGLPYDRVIAKAREDFVFRLIYHARTVTFLATDTKLLFVFVAFWMAVLGLALSPLFYCFHLLDIVNKSTDLQSVFKAVTLNGRSILMTAVFGFIIIYIYAIVGFSFGQDLFVAGDYPDPDIDWCTNLFVCWVSAVTNGLREGDIGKIMEPRGSDDPRYPFLVLYQFSYYLIVITVLLNVIFGIIIDTFGELRTTAAAKTFAMENNCFVCGVDRFTFETKGNGFHHHIFHDHNMWSYLFMIVYLREKENTEYNGWEQYVADKMKVQDLSFFPVNNAVVLKEYKEREAREGRQLTQQIAECNANVVQLSKQYEKLEKNVSDKVDVITTMQATLQQALTAGLSMSASPHQSNPNIERRSRASCCGNMNSSHAASSDSFNSHNGSAPVAD